MRSMPSTGDVKTRLHRVTWPFINHQSSAQPTVHRGKTTFSFLSDVNYFPPKKDSAGQQGVQVKCGVDFYERELKGDVLEGQNP